MRRYSSVLYLFIGFVFACGSACAASYHVDSVLPRAAQAGTEIDVTFNGTKLADPLAVMFYGPGIEASGLAMVTDKGVTEGSKVKVHFKIAKDARIGEHLVRLRTSTMICECVTFWVTPFPIVDEKEKKMGENDTPELAQAVPLNTTVAGQILSGEMLDRDCYKVDMKKGQRLSAEVASVRLASTHGGGDNDLMLRILDPHGKQLARDDDSAMFVQDPLLSIAVPEDGSYTVEVTQQMFQANITGWYLLHIGNYVRPTAIYPLGGQAGQKLEARNIGDPLGASTQIVSLPAKPGNFDFFAGKPGETPATPNVLRVSEFPNTNEIEPNDTLATATPVPSLPAALNGIIEKAGDVDCFRFKVEKGKSWRVRVFARGLGTAIDPKIWIKPLSAGQDGPIELEKDDSTLAERDHIQSNSRWHSQDLLDPSVVFTPRQSGDYVLGVEDTRGQGGEAYVYRVEIEPVENRIFAFMPNANNNRHYQGFYRLDIPQGARLTRTISLGAAQGNTFTGEMELEALNLPKGVTMIAPHFKGLTTLPVQFICEPNAELQGTLVELRAKPVDPKVTIKSETAYGMSYLDKRGGYGWHFVFVDKIAVGVVKAAPYTLEIEQPEIALVQNAELSLKFKVKRESGFNQPLQIQSDWLPNGVTGDSEMTLAEGASEGTFVLHAENKAAAGAFRISLTAGLRAKDSNYGVSSSRVSSNNVDLKVAEPYLTMVIKRAAIERGQKGQILCDIKLNKEFPGKATLTLKRLPPGIKVLEPIPQITSQDKQVTFQIEATPEALVGQYKEIFCEVVVTENGQSIRQTTGSGILRIDPARVHAAAN